MTDAGKKQEPCKEQVGPGALVAVAKLKHTATGDTLCSEKEPFVFAAPKLPSQVLSYALVGSKEDEDKMMMAVHKLLEEDTSLKLEHNDETGDILLSGMGQQHIEMAVEKVKRRNKVDARLQEPRIPYKETLKAGADDFLAKPLDLDHFLIAVERSLETRRLRREVQRMRE